MYFIAITVWICTALVSVSIGMSVGKVIYHLTGLIEPYLYAGLVVAGVLLSVYLKVAGYIYLPQESARRLASYKFGMFFVFLGDVLLILVIVITASMKTGGASGLLIALPGLLMYVFLFLGVFLVESARLATRARYRALGRRLVQGGGRG